MAKKTVDGVIMSDQYYQFYVGDYQRDTCDLTLIEHGAYRVLLDYYYMHESLPVDRDRCLRIARAFTQAEQEAVDNVIFRFFKKVGDVDKLQNKRADIEIEKRKAFISAQSERGHKGAEARWGKENKSQIMPQAMPQAMHKQWPDDGQPSPSPSQTKTKKDKTLVVYSNDFLSFWEKYPKKSGSKKTAFDNWQKLSGGRPTIEIILEAIRKQIEWRKNAGGKFRPEWKDPERWIKGKMWEVELTEENKSSW